MKYFTSSSLSTLSLFMSKAIHPPHVNPCKYPLVDEYFIISLHTFPLDTHLIHIIF